jgi:hypothetical protein
VQTSHISFEFVSSGRQRQTTWSFRVADGQGQEEVTRAWMKAIMKATVVKRADKPVYSSLASPTVPLKEAQMFREGLLPEECRARRVGLGVYADMSVTNIGLVSDLK